LFDLETASASADAVSLLLLTLTRSMNYFLILLAYGFEYFPGGS